MSIKPQSYRDGQPTPWEYLEAGAIADCQIGMALTVESGKLVKASGNVKPSYISMYGKATEEGQQIPVIRADNETLYMTQFSTAAPAVKVGDKVTIDATGTMATANTVDGVLEVVQIMGNAEGDDVIVRIS